jgi:cardiolipin-specific phospholipase
MDPEGGEQSVENLRKAGNGEGRSYIVNNAGHHGASFLLQSYLIFHPSHVSLPVYLDNPKAVNDLIVKELDRRRK